MKLTIDTEQQKLTSETGGVSKTLPLYSAEAFELISQQWLKIGWDQKYVYTFSWLGRPIIQLPEDIVRIQETIFRLQPDVIIETGIAHGGSLIFYASLCKILGKGRVIGIDIDIRQHNRKAIESHPLFSYLTLIEGDSTDKNIASKVKSLVKPGEKVLVLLDSCHAKKHVLTELEMYHSLVSPGSYIVATDGIMRDVSDVPRGETHWNKDNPAEAAAEFVKEHKDFVLEPPAVVFNESPLKSRVTHWPNAWLRKL